MTHQLNCHYCHAHAVIETGSGCECTACGQTWRSISTFIRERFYQQSRSDEPARAMLASTSTANPKRLAEQWAGAIHGLPRKFSITLLKLVTRLALRLVTLFITTGVNLLILVVVTYPLLIFTPLFLKIRGRNRGVNPTVS